MTTTHKFPSLEVGRGLDDGGLAEPGDLGPGVALHLAHKLDLGPVRRALGLDLVSDLRGEGLFVPFRLLTNSN